MAKYIFGRYTIDQACRELRCEQQSVTVQPRVFDLLLYLIEQRDRAVDKDELQDAVWGTIVTEDALTRAIMKARRAVGDNASEQQVIRTIHGHGYRFIAPVELDPDTTAAANPAPAFGKAGASQTSDKRWWVWAVAAGVAVLTLLIAFTSGSKLQANGSIGVAVLPIANTVDDPELSWAENGLMQLTARIIDDLPGLDTVSSRTILSTLPEDLLTAPEAVRIAAVSAEISQRLGTQAFVASTLSKQAGSYIIDYTLQHQGKDYAGRVQADQPPAAAEQLARTVARRILGTPVRNSTAIREITDNNWINELYARGMAKQLAGDTEGAKTLFKAAVDEDPDYFWPAYEYALSLRDTGGREEAITRLQQLEAQPGIDNEQQMAVHNALGIAYWRERDYARAEAHYEQGLKAAEQLRDLIGSATLLTNLGILARITGQPDQARQYIERALLATQRAGARQGSPYHSLGQIERLLGNINAAHRNYARAAEIYADNGYLRNQAISLRMLARMTARLGDLDSALAHLEQSQAIAESVNADSEINRAIIYRAWVIDLLGQYQVTSGLDQIKATLSADNVVYAEAAEMSAMAALRNGDLQQARRDADIARTIYIDHDIGDGQLSAETILAWVDALEGNLTSADQQLQHLVDSARESKQLYAEIKARHALGETLLLRGELAAAQAQLVSARQMSVKNGDLALEWSIAPALGSVYLKTGNMEAATAMAGVVSTATVNTLAGYRFLARHAAAENNTQTAIDLMSEARLTHQAAWSQQDEAFVNEQRQLLDN